MSFETALRSRARRIAAMREGLPLPPVDDAEIGELALAGEGQGLSLAPPTADFAEMVAEETLRLRSEIREQDSPA